MQFPLQIPFVAHLGFELVRMADGQAEIHCRVRPELHNSWQVAHGGLVMTLLDVCMAHAARSHEGVPKPGEVAAPGLVTLEMKTQFMRPGESHLVAEASVLHRTATLAFTEGRVFNLQADGSRSPLCAHATATFKYLKALATSQRSIHSVVPSASD
jgi:uncharacterized protein (TIGR00369 family)